MYLKIQDIFLQNNGVSMEIIIIFSALIFIFLSISLILPWINRNQIKNLKYEVSMLKKYMEKLLPESEEKKASDTSKTQNMPPSQNEPSSLDAHVKSIPILKESKINFEEQFGKRLPVWIGGVALALAGIFMVKYSIETGLLSPIIRVLIGFIFGIGLLFGADWIQKRPEFSNGMRISQSLSGAGIADLYACVFSASNLYEIISPSIGFLGMAMVTATAVVLSIRHGIPIALIGLIGGFLTPALVSSDNLSNPIIFVYLYFVVAGLMTLIRQQGWWWMGIPTLLGSFLWVSIWVFFGIFSILDTVYLGIFLITVSGTIIVASNKQYDQELEKAALNITPILNYLTFLGVFILTGLISYRAGFGPMEWGLFTILSLGCIALAIFNQRLYGLAPWLSMVQNIVILILWDKFEPSIFAYLITGFSFLYIFVGYIFQSRSKNPILWAGLTAFSGVIYYLVAYYKLQGGYILPNFRYFWGMLALFMALLGTHALKKILVNVPKEHPQQQHLMTIYAVAVSTFFSLGILIELTMNFLATAFSVKIFCIALINTKVEISALRYIIQFLTGVFGLILTPEISDLFFRDSHTSLTILQFGIQGICFALASYLLRFRKEDNVVFYFEIITASLFLLMTYSIVGQIFQASQAHLFIRAEFFERNMMTNILFLYSLGLIWVGKKFTRESLILTGISLARICLIRTIGFELLISNPLWEKQMVGEYPLFNALILAYGFPIIWFWKACFTLPKAYQNEKINRAFYGIAFILLFTLISLSTRQLFHGTFLNEMVIYTGEIYTYSVVWVLFGLGLLILGTLRKDKVIRMTSLVVMNLTVGKVFLYDASNLEGILRVFSFAGLGFSLLGLSWFYTKFVRNK